MEDCTTPPRRSGIRVNLLHSHGSPTMYLYRRRGCRCPLCCAAQSEYYRGWRETHRDEKAAYDRGYHLEHRESRLPAMRRYRADHVEERAEQDRLYHQAHRDEKSTYHKTWRLDNIKEVRASNRAYYRAHPEEYRVHSRNRRARKAATTGTHTAADVRAQYERQRGKCFWRNVNPDCSVSLQGGYHTDHVVPLAGERASSNGPENLVLACPKCNLSKRAKDPMDWAGVMF